MALLKKPFHTPELYSIQLYYFLEAFFFLTLTFNFMINLEMNFMYDPVMALIFHSGHPSTDTLLTPLWTMHFLGRDMAQKWGYQWIIMSPTMDTSIAVFYLTASGLNCLGKQKRERKKELGRGGKRKEKKRREGEGKERRGGRKNKASWILNWSS